MSNNEEKLDDTSSYVRGFGIKMPKYEFQKMEIHDKPAGFSEEMMEKAKKEPMPRIPPPPLPKEED